MRVVLGKLCLTGLTLGFSIWEPLGDIRFSKGGCLPGLCLLSSTTEAETRYQFPAT